MDNLCQYLHLSAEKYPDRKAFAYRDCVYTFADSEALARRLAAKIDAAYERSPVAVFAGRNAHSAILFLAVLSSGNYYIPIDPDMPVEKMQAILDDAKPRYILGCAEDRALLEKLSHEARFLTPEDAADEPRPMPEISPDAPAYMVYTSGSTGKPKGVLKSHGAVISFIEAYCDTFGFSSDDIIGNQTPFFFDASAKDFYLALKTGASLEIIPTELFAMPPMLIEYLNEKRISFICWVPSALAIVSQLRTFSYVLPETLKRVFFVGEVMPMKHLNVWRRALPDVEFVNLYGQSEIAGICCYFPVEGEFEDSAVLPMGKAMKNCRIYLESDGQLITEHGKLGEMYICSDALATEYFGDAEKTEACFTLRSFDGAEPVRCFKTGDLAQYDKKGNLVFAARTDFQIKHMGHRIELGEIEAVAGSLPEIARCCCLYDSVKSKIILFCELSEGAEMKAAEIRSALRPKLSSYMLPGAVKIMDSLPLNPNGKIDRQKLKELI